MHTRVCERSYKIPLLLQGNPSPNGRMLHLHTLRYRTVGIGMALLHSLPTRINTSDLFPLYEMMW